MLRNVDSTDSEVSRTLTPKHLPNGSESNVPEIRKAPFRERALAKGLLVDKVPDCDEMPLLESSPQLDGPDGVPASPEMPTLVPFALDCESGLDAHLTKNGYYRLNKENLGDSETSHLKTMSGVASSPLVSPSSAVKKRRGRPRKRPRLTLSVDRASTDRRFQPVVLLKRLSVEQPPEFAESRDSSNDSWSQWPEEYEGCSYDDFVCEPDGSESFPEVDLIDGVEFLSFLQEGDVKEFALKDKHSVVFPSDASCTDMESCPDGSKDDQAFIVPTKTRDITQIKGWKRKVFLEDNFASAPSSVSSNFPESEIGDREDDSSRDAVHSGRSSPAVSTRSSSATPSSRTRSSKVPSGTPGSDDYAVRRRREEPGARDFDSADVSVFERSFQDSLRLPGTPPESYDLSEDEEDAANESVELENVGLESRDSGSPKETKERGSPAEDEGPDKREVDDDDEDDEEEDAASKDEPERGALEEDNVLLLGEQPDLYGTAKTSAFASRSLDDFLDKHSTLNVSLLKECDPVVNFIPVDHPVLKIGSLKMDERHVRKKRCPFPMPYRYPLQVKASMRTPQPRKVIARDPRLLPKVKEKVVAKTKVRVAKEPGPVAQAESSNVAPHESRIVFADEDSNGSSVSSRRSKSSREERWTPAPDFEQNSNERRELFNDSFEGGDVPKKDEDSEHSNFYIDHYEPVTVDEAALAQSTNNPFEVIRETVWSVKDTIREERLMYDLLCELKSPDNYLISKIKFADEGLPEVDELLTEDDAKEVSKWLYLGYGSLQEMVKEVTALEEAKRVQREKSLQLAREQRQKKRAQLRTVQGFVKWYRAESVTEERQTGDEKSRTEPASPRRAKKRRIRPPARFLDGAPLSDDELTLLRDSDRRDRLHGNSKTVLPHSAALPLVFDNPEAAESAAEEPPSTAEDVCSRSSSSQEVGAELDDAPSPASPPGSESELSDPDEASNAVSGTDESRKPERVDTTEEVDEEASEAETDAPSETVQNVNSSLTASANPEAKRAQSNCTSSPDSVVRLPTSPDAPKLMVVNVTVPVCDKIDELDATQTKNSEPVAEPTADAGCKSPPVSSPYLGIVLNNGVHTITPRNASHIEKISMNLKSAVNLDSKARIAIRSRRAPPPFPQARNVLHLTPLNEYKWKPTSNNSSKSPIIKSFLIDSTKRTGASNSDVLNLPLAAVAQPVTGTAFPNENIYLLYGSLDGMASGLVQCGEEQASKGLTVRVGDQELLLSCSITLARAPVRLNAIIGRVVTPLLLYPALTPKNEKQVASEAGKAATASPIEQPRILPKVPVSSNVAKTSEQPGVSLQCTLQGSAALHSQNAQHFRILTKDNKVTVENLPQVPAVARARFPTPISLSKAQHARPPTARLLNAAVTRMPRSVFGAVTPRGPNQLRFPGPASSFDPRKMLILPRHRMNVTPDSIIRRVEASATREVAPSVVTSALFQSFSNTISSGASTVSFTTSVFHEQLVGLPRVAPPTDGQYLYVQNSGLASPTEEQMQFVEKEADVQVLSSPTRDEEVSDPDHIDQDCSDPTDILPENTLDEAKDTSKATPEFQITDVRTCSPPAFDTEANGSPDKEPSSLTTHSVVDIASEEEDETSSLWISGEGETCFVMRLPEEEDVEGDLSDGPHVVTCS